MPPTQPQNQNNPIDQSAPPSPPTSGSPDPSNKPQMIPNSATLAGQASPYYQYGFAPSQPQPQPTVSPPQPQSSPLVDAIAQVGQPTSYQIYSPALAQSQLLSAQSQQLYGTAPTGTFTSDYIAPQPSDNVVWSPSAPSNLPPRHKLKTSTIAIIVGAVSTILVSLAVIIFVVLGQLGNSHSAFQTAPSNQSSYSTALSSPTPPPTPTPIPPLPTYPTPPDIQIITDRIGISDQVKTIQFVESSNIATDCQSDFAFACADIANDRIFYSAINLKSVDSLYQNTSIAHEYLHIFWYRLENPNYAQTAQLNITKDQIKEKLKAIYELHYPALDKRLSDYFNSGLMQVGNESFYTELHSFVGTEMNDNELPPDLLEYYTQILPVRTQFSKYY